MDISFMQFLFPQLPVPVGIDIDTSFNNNDWTEIARKNIGASQSDLARQELQALDAIQLFLQNRSTAADTAKALAKIFEPTIKLNSESPLLQLWGLFDAAVTLSTGQKDMADLLLAVRDLPDCCGRVGNAIFLGAGVVWRDLPRWGFMFREWIIRIDVIYTMEEEGPKLVLTEYDIDFEKARDLVKATEFAAHILVGLPADDHDKCGGMSGYANIALDMGLERSHDTQGEKYRVYRWELLVLPAAMGILIAGERISELCQLRVDAQFSHSESKKTFCEQRWEMWKQRMHELEEPAGIEERFQGLARSAADRMDEIDGG